MVLFFRLHEQNWNNLYLLLVSLILSYFSSMVNNRFTGQRPHNITKLINEMVSRGNLVFVFYSFTLTILAAGNDTGRKLLHVLFGVSVFLWFISLFVAEHIILYKVDQLHTCDFAEDNSERCKIMPGYFQAFWMSKWNFLISFVLLLLSSMLAASKWTCGPICKQQNFNIECLSKICSA